MAGTVNPSTPQLRNKTERQGAAGRCQSLVRALREIARRAGSDLNHDDLSAALGLCWSPVAVPTEPDLGLWPLYARDAFLPEAGRLFGLTIRDMHPPEAARGLSAAAEFAQHFDASYRPLIRRALEHDQPVLAWQGPVGDRGMCWGVIRGVCDGGVGFEAEVFDGGEASGPRKAITLATPPVQLYVVESAAPSRPEIGALIELVLRNADIVLSNGLADRFGVVTGPGAYDRWIERLDVQGESRGEVDRLLAAHRRLTSAALTGCESGIRCLQRNHLDAGAAVADRAARLMDGMREVARELRIAASSELGTEGDCKVRSALTRARDAMRSVSPRQTN